MTYWTVRLQWLLVDFRVSRTSPERLRKIVKEIKPNV